MISLIILLNLVNLIFCFIPNWNLNTSGQDLLSSDYPNNYLVSDRKMHDMLVKLIKTLKNVEGKIYDDNTLIVNDGDKISVEFENIESFSDNIICPRGRNFLYDVNTHQNIILYPQDFNDSEDWDLKCYRHDTGYLLVFYLMKKSDNFYFGYIDRQNINYNNIHWMKSDIFPFVFDFRLHNGVEKEVNGIPEKYKFLGLILENETIKLKNFNVTFYENYEYNQNIIFEPKVEEQKALDIIPIKSYYKALFKNNSDEFYFITYNNSSDIISGYSTHTTNNYDELNTFQFKTNYTSPFDFIDEVEIKELDFILNNKYMYYTLLNKDNNKTYHGIYDIKLNKIIFNTDEVILKFIPFSNNSMLAITEKTAYQICALKDKEGNCVEECPHGQKIIFDVDGNKCGDITQNCDDDKILLYPYDICVKECDNDKFIFLQNTCGLCKKYFPEKPYHIKGSNECLDSIPDNTDIYNLEAGLLVCKENYYLEDNMCKLKCSNEKCLSCSEESNRNNLCLMCDENKGYFNVKTDNNFYDCLLKNDSKLEKYYFNKTLNEYRPCYDLCKKCESEGNTDSHNCEECIDGYMLKPGNNPNKICVEYSEYYYISNNEYHPLKIYQCPLEAMFYIKNKKSCIDNCTNDSDKYNYLHNGNCLKRCPNDTYEDNYLCKIDSEECYELRNNIILNNDDNNLSFIKPLVNSYIYEFYYTNNAISTYYYSKDDDLTRLYIFKNLSCIDILNTSYINLTSLDLFFNDLIVYCVLIKKVEGKYQAQNLFFNAKTGEEIQFNQDNQSSYVILKNENDTQKIKMNYSEVVSNFDGNNIITTDEDNSKIYEVSYLSEQNKNVSYVNLGKCEQIIKTTYGLEDEELVIIKIEHEIEEFNIPIIDYLIFDQKGNQLGLNCCSNTTIEYEIPVTINESEVYKYNPNSFYYNDICYPAQSENGVDITIFDRKNEYNDKNLALCQIDCTFKSYDYENKKAICECEVKDKLDIDEIFEVDKDKLLKSFISIKNMINIDPIKCYKLIFSDNGLLKNYGSYIILTIISISIISSIVLLVKEFNTIKDLIQNIIKNIINKESNTIINEEKKEKEIKIKKTKTKKNILSFPPKKGKKKKIKKTNTQFIASSKNFEIKNSNDTINIFKPKEIENINNEKINDYEMNNLPYKKAVIIDQRNYCDYYISLIKTKQLIAFSFFLSTDYNLKTVKICLFFLTLALNLTVNALFFNDSTMHKIYEDNGNYNFLYQLPQILYSLLISVFIKTILSLLSLTEKSIIQLKEVKKDNDNNNNINNNEKYASFIKCIKIKLIIFFIFYFIFLIAFWYYLSCFCALYKNTQTHLIKDTLSSFALSLFYPFLLNLIPGLLRISALKNKNNGAECMYNTSKILQLI